MNKKWLIGIVILILIAGGTGLYFLLPQSNAPYENLLANSNFERGSEEWLKDAYVNTTGYTEYEVRTGEGRNGSTALYIKNMYPNDARFWQEVSVEPETVYHLHGYIKSAAEGGKGANLSVEGVYAFSDSVYDSENEWQEVSLYGTTGKNQKSLKIYVRLGGYSGESAGEAWFDDVTFTRVDKVPSSYPNYTLYQPPVENGDDNELYFEEKTALVPMLLGAAGYTAVLYFCAQYMKKKDQKKLLQNHPKRKYLFLFLWCLLAVTIRCVLAVLVHGYNVDVHDFKSWAAHMAHVGPVNFYNTVGFCDYPPGYLLVLWLIGGLGSLFGGISNLLVKMPSILCDLALVILLYRTAEKWTGDEKIGWISTVLYALNPLTMTAGAAWGQVDSMMTLLLCLVVYFAVLGKWRFALPIYVIAVLMKPQALMFGPLGLIVLIVSFVKVYQSGNQNQIRNLWQDFLQGMALLILAAVLIILPFSIHQGGIKWIFELYGRTMSHYHQITVNSCNLYFLFGLNWVDVGESVHWTVALSASLILFVPCIAFAFLGKQNKTVKAVILTGSVTITAALAALAVAGTLNYTALGTVMIALGVMISFALYLRGNQEKHLPMIGALMLIVLFTLGTMMHERYMFPALALLLMAYMLEKDRRILYLMVLLTVSALFNVGSVLDRNIRIGGSAGHLTAPRFGIDSDLSVLEYISAGLQVIGCMAALYLSLDLCRKDAQPKDFVPYNREKLQAEKNTEESPYRKAFEENKISSCMDKKDYLLMGLITVLFAVFTFTNLGSFKAPQTEYVFTSPNEQVIFDLGEEKTFKLLYYQGIHWQDNDFQAAVSDDGRIWRNVKVAKVPDGGDCFKWQYVVESYESGETLNFTKTPVEFTGRYVRITAQNVGLTLFEVLPRDLDGNPLPMTLVSGAEDAKNLADERDTLKGEPGWFNSMYFDEIYHARTGYEMLHGMQVYEWTHPPLGKILMSLSIAVFGMTPFGWRFAGALMGVLMLPGMYLLGKQLFKRRWGAVGAALLMALDFMHFTQTRIATIDSFVVCFIIWAVYFMIRYMTQDYWGTKYWKTFVPLALSGLFMALSVASKWTGCYAGVGLAVLFFWTVFRRVQEVRYAKNVPEKNRNERMKTAAEKGYKYILYNILSCFGFFVAVPLLVYYLSYIPACAFKGGVSVKLIIEESENMLRYHGQPGLGMDHFFYSPWYEWPLAMTPMWYSSTAYAPEGTASTIMAFGNPAVWWTGALAMVILVLEFCCRHVRKDGRLRVHPAHEDRRGAVLLLCFLAQYLPWVLVPRGTYIYHYFACVPFIILAAVYLWDRLEDYKKGWGKILLSVQLLLALALMIAFFPYISGAAANVKWLDAMKWFPGWLYY